MTNTEKAVTWGVLAFIAWELWQRSTSAAPPSGGMANCNIIDYTGGAQAPGWIDQLAATVETPLTCGE